jgi:hypothetical protein
MIDMLDEDDALIALMESLTLEEKVEARKTRMRLNSHK